ncbi:MAG: hypothetical protein VYC19_10805 [Pseudomonadota bacterium]|jgi:hypothetical protein|nr:hypothetical protein [Pseudomonadota bacterium]MEC9236052.1 hypothetical protein [Pseudomonadota bacterium]
MQANLPKTYKTLTISRQDLIDFSERLAACLPPDFLKNLGRPLRIAVNGSLQSGKKIIPDFMRDTLLSADAVNGRTGNVNYDEKVSGRLADQDIDISYIDLAWDQYVFSFYDPDAHGAPCTWSNQKTLDSHLQGHSEMGVAFIQNADSRRVLGHINAAPDISIWVEKDDYRQNQRFLKSQKCFGLGQKLAENFSKASIDEGWGRYIEVELHTPELQESAPVQKLLKDFKFEQK